MGALSREQWEAHHNATHYHICEKPFTPDDTRIRDHCHLTGRYRGPAHSNRNLNYKNSFYIPIVFHNLSGYDSHFIIKEIAAIFEGKIDVLPKNTKQCHKNKNIYLYVYICEKIL